MKKNGFIATSLLYSFFLLFISLFIALVSNYLHNQELLKRINERATDGIVGHSKLNFGYNFTPGDYFTFKTKNLASENKLDSKMNDHLKWILLKSEDKIEDEKIVKKITFISDGNVLLGNDNSGYSLSLYLSKLKDINGEVITDKFEDMFDLGQKYNNAKIELSIPTIDDINYIKDFNADTLKNMYDSSNDEKMQMITLNDMGINDENDIAEVVDSIKNIFKTESNDSFYIKRLSDNNYHQMGNLEMVDNYISNSCIQYPDDTEETLPLIPFEYTSFCIRNDSVVYDEDGNQVEIESENNEELVYQNTAVVGRMMLTITIEDLAYQYKIQYGKGTSSVPYYVGSEEGDI